MAEYNVSVTLVTEVCYDCAGVWARIQNRSHLVSCPYCSQRKLAAVMTERDELERSNRSLRGTITKMKFKGYRERD